MEIIDAQIHRPAPARDWDPIYSEQRKRDLDVELAVAAMDAVGVDAAIVHSDLHFCVAAVTRLPDRFAGVVQYREPLAVASPRGEISRLSAQPGIVGFRLMPAWPPESPDNLMPALREGRLDPFFEAGETAGLPLVLFIPEELRDVPAIAERYPGLTVIVDHIGMLPPPQVPLTPNLLDSLPDLLALARHPNVAVKFSRLPGLSLEGYPFSDLWRRAAHQIIEAFTPSRLLWGSDYTRLKGLRTYSESVDFIRYSDELSVSDKEEILGKATRRWFRWQPIAHSDHIWRT